MARAYVGLGANLGDRERTLRLAIERMGEIAGVAVVAESSLRETDPVGVVDQPRFLNGAVELETTLPPRELLAALIEVERGLGRIRSDGERWGPRTLDLDLLLYDNLVLDEPGLVVPHTRLIERRFALEPLADLDPDLEVAGHGRVSTLLAELED